VGFEDGASDGLEMVGEADGQEDGVVVGLEVMGLADGP